MTRLINSDEELAALSLPDLRKQVKARRDLIKDMVGQLYPSVLQGEINAILERIREREKEEDKR